jgi:DNA (cytosine-5)-methyltransferase 1
MLLGHTCVCAVEIEPYCRKVLLQRQRDGILPKFPIWDDVRTFDGKPWKGLVDVVCAGFPCQVHSDIGKIHGSSGFDGWPDTARIIGEVQPTRILLENVPAILQGFWGTVLRSLAELGYNCRWGVFCCPAAARDAAIISERVFALATTISDRLEAPKTGLAVCAKGWKPALPSAAISSTWSSGLPKPTIQRVPDGLANYMGELKAIGNGQVPAVVRLAWETLSA